MDSSAGELQDRGAATVTAAAGRRRPATGTEQERRITWGKEWGKIASDAGRATREGN